MDEGRREDHRQNTELLNAELPDRRFADESYLSWLYDANPLGRAYTHSIDDESGRRVGHYALIPQRYRDRNGPAGWRHRARPGTARPRSGGRAARRRAARC